MKYRARYDMKPLEPTVRFIAGNGDTTTMGYLVWPNHNPANYYYANKAARARIAAAN